MNLKGIRESKNYVDTTGNPSLFARLGGYLLKNGIINDATGHPYQPPYQPPTPSKPGDWPTIGAGANIDYGHGAAQPFVSAPANPDAYARAHGFPSAAAMMAWQQNRQRALTGPANSSNDPLNGDTLQTILAIHPAMILQHVLDRMNSALKK
jgi:hypothetical protein